MPPSPGLGGGVAGQQVTRQVSPPSLVTPGLAKSQRLRYCRAVADTFRTPLVLRHPFDVLSLHNVVGMIKLGQKSRGLVRGNLGAWGWSPVRSVSSRHH